MYVVRVENLPARMIVMSSSTVHATSFGAGSSIQVAENANVPRSAAARRSALSSAGMSGCANCQFSAVGLPAAKLQLQPSRGKISTPRRASWTGRPEALASSSALRRDLVLRRGAIVTCRHISMVVASCCDTKRAPGGLLHATDLSAGEPCARPNILALSQRKLHAVMSDRAASKSLLCAVSLSGGGILHRQDDL